MATPEELFRELVLGTGRFIDLIPMRIQDRHAVFRAKDMFGQECAIKVATAKPERDNLVNEVETTRLLSGLHKNMFIVHPETTITRFPFAVPEVLVLHEEEDCTIASYAFVPGEPLAKDASTPVRLSYDVLRQVSDAMCELHRLTASDIGPYFIDRQIREFSWRAYLERLSDTYLSPCIERGLISRQEAQGLFDTVDELCKERRFVHHDLGPWNLIQVPGEATVYLVDAEFARWGMKWYDQAYYYLQVAILAGDRASATTALQQFASDVRRYHPQENFRQEVFGPLAYRLGANLWLALRDEAQAERARTILPLILKRDFDGLLAI